MVGISTTPPMLKLLITMERASNYSSAKLFYYWNPGITEESIMFVDVLKCSGLERFYQHIEITCLRLYI